MSRGFGPGRTAGLVSAVGLGTGSLLHAIAATLGLSAIVTYSPVAYAVVKYLGAAYLLYLGVSLLRQRPVRLTDAVLPGLSPSRTGRWRRDRKSTRLNSSHIAISYAV